MRPLPGRDWRAAGLVALVLIGGSVLVAAGPPEAPKVSKFAPADDLNRQVDVYLEELDKALASEEAYSEEANRTRVAKNAHSLAALAVALGLHDQPHPRRETAAGLMQAAQTLATAKDFESARTACEAVKQAAASKEPVKAELTWNKKVGSLGKMMLQVGTAHSQLQRGMRRFDRLAEANARHAATLAVIAQASTVDTHEVKDPAEFDRWYELCAQMRDAAGDVNAAIRAKDETAAGGALKRLTQSCETCHAEFR